MYRLPLSKGLFAEVDAEDFAALSAYKWTADVRRSVTYARRNVGKKKLYLHVAILGLRPGYVIDHVNRNGLDCRRSNLRHVSKAQNSANVEARPERGISLHQGKWTAQIHVSDVKFHLGRFVTKEEARAAYLAVAKEWYGEYRTETL